MDNIKLLSLKKDMIGKKILSIIRLEATNDIVQIFKHYEINGSKIDELQLILFDDRTSLLFVDFDCDGYRSGEWDVFLIEGILDKGLTKEIKNINSEVLDIKYNDNNSIQQFLIITKNYIIGMGQDNTDSYYPSNFFNVDEALQFAITNMRRLDFSNNDIS